MYATSPPGKGLGSEVSIEFENWRFNLRMSNTEPVVRLNVETRGDLTLLEQRVGKILEMLDSR
ncbi:MAG: hypothetical protein C4575_14440 [Desulforudis sp.]|nr:MAG: hypothetical protein C4575_14440 [Desulforudis sp.]